MTPQEQAGDPGTAPEQLVRRLLSHPRQVLANPVFLLLFLEDPTWLERLAGEYALVRLLLQPDLPSFLVEHLSRSNAEEVREAASMHVALEALPEAWEAAAVLRLAALPCDVAHREVLRAYGLLPSWLCPHLPPPLVEGSQEDLELYQKERQAWKLQSYYVGEVTSPMHLRLLADDPQHPKYVVQGNAFTPRDILSLFADRGDCDWDLSKNLAAPAEVLEKILARQVSGEPDPEVLRELADHPNLTREQGVTLQERFGLSPPVLLSTAAFLAQVQDKKVRKRQALARSDVPLVLKWDALADAGLLRTSAFAYFCRVLVVEEARFLVKPAMDTQWYFRFAVAIHPLATELLLQGLADDANHFVRAAARARLEGGGAWKSPAS